MQTQNCAHQIKIVLLRDLPCEGKGSFDDTPGFGYECDHMIKVLGQRFHAQEGGAKY